ncbi:hypothetical protein [Pseudomonas extremaustralis]|nr:hypothetical protein [Pseudomonas extremaustralis]
MARDMNRAMRVVERTDFLDDLGDRVIRETNCPEGKTMARSKRTDYAKVKIWMPNMISDVEGTIAGVALETFTAIGDKFTREQVLKLMTERHEAICKREADRNAA